MYAKIEITGTIRSLTGMHIGGSPQFAAIGAVDSPVVKDPLTKVPMIPGSSLKGKLRSLIARQYNGGFSNHNEDDVRILRLFGAAKDGKDKSIWRTRLFFPDILMSERTRETFRRMGVSETEIKFENNINRLTAEATPRQIERSVRGAEYDFTIIYDAANADEIIEDFETIRDAMLLLEYDYLGGHGSRGYGKVKFSDLDADCVIGELEDEILNQCVQILKEVER